MSDNKELPSWILDWILTVDSYRVSLCTLYIFIYLTVLITGWMLEHYMS